MGHKDIEDRRAYQRAYQRTYSATHPRTRDWSKVNRTRSERLVPKDQQCARDGCCKRLKINNLCYRHSG